MSQPVNQNATWRPQLDGLGLPRALTNGISQAFALIYSYRDQTENNLAALTNNLANLIRYGTHADRLNTPPASVPNGALWFETDQGNVLYQVRIPPPTAAGNLPQPSWVRLGTLQP